MVVAICGPSDTLLRMLCHHLLLHATSVSNRATARSGHSRIVTVAKGLVHGTAFSHGLSQGGTIHWRIPSGMDSHAYRGLVGRFGCPHSLWVVDFGCRRYSQCRLVECHGVFRHDATDTATNGIDAIHHVGFFFAGPMEH